jgi:hypothetical protein
MKLPSNENDCGNPAVGVVLPDLGSEIALKGTEMLKLQFDQPGAVVKCTSGALWLTQPGDLHDHIVKAGEVFQLYGQGTVLVQGLPRGRILILAGLKEPGAALFQHHGDKKWKWFSKPYAR